MERKEGEGCWRLLLSCSLLLILVLSCQKRAPRNEIAFVSDRAGNQDIYLLNVDTDSVFALTQDGAEDWSPAWSPDGSKLAFASTRDGGWNIYVMKVKTWEVVQLTDSGQDRWPSWSPDGSRIAFASERDGSTEIYTVRSDGSDLRNVTDHRARDDRPSWSPDGERIAFCSNRDGDWDLYVLSLKTGEVERLTDNAVPDYPGAWSRDGKGIVFASNFDIVQYSFERGVTTKLTSGESKEGSPGYSPGGERIVFDSDRSGDYDIWVMQADGTGFVNLTQHPAFDWFPRWRSSRK